MVYNGYKWEAWADHDNPEFIGAQEHSELNRSEGYEMLYFPIALHLHGIGVTTFLPARD